MTPPLLAAAAVLQAAAETQDPLVPMRLPGLMALLRAAFLLAAGLPFVYALARGLRRWVTRNSTPQRGLIIDKLIFYPGVIIILVSTLAELGFRLGPLLGAAGVLGIAIGFASQTSVSNVISGFFLMAEQPFVVDDVIQVGTTTGRVLSIDMMSVKLRTLDNRFVRIPNEAIVKSEVTNVTRFPIRRVDMRVGVAYKEDLRKVREALLEVAAHNPLALREPEPLLVFQGYGDSSIDFLFAVWTTRENYLQLVNTLPEDVKYCFDGRGIEIPFPHRTLYVGPGSAAVPVRLVGEPGPPFVEPKNPPKRC
jgi:small-conductance mechanosensitive channel